jgi:hypothetical protein
VVVVVVVVAVVVGGRVVLLDLVVVVDTLAVDVKRVVVTVVVGSKHPLLYLTPEMALGMGMVVGHAMSSVQTFNTHSC